MPYQPSSEHTRIVRDHCEKRFAAVDHKHHPDSASESENDYPSLHAAASVVSPSNNVTSSSRLQTSSVGYTTGKASIPPQGPFTSLLIFSSRMNLLCSFLVSIETRMIAHGLLESGGRIHLTCFSEGGWALPST